MSEQLQRQIKQAQNAIRKRKECCPYDFIEYVWLQEAKRKLAAAQRDYDEALEKWEKLGNE